MSKRLNKYNWGKSTKYFYSHKNQAFIWLEGSFERVVALHMEFCDSVHGYVSQPFSVVYRDEFNQERKYTPDFLVRNIYKKPKFKTLEVKGKKWFELDLNFQAHLPYIIEALEQQRSLSLALVDEDSIAQGQRLKNYKRLYYFKRIIVEKHLRLSSLRSELGTTFNLSELRDFLEFKNIPDCVAGSILAHQHVEFDFDSQLQDTTLLELK